MLSMFTNPHYSNQPKLEGEKYNHYEHEREKKERRTSAFPFIHFGRFWVLSTPASSPLFWEICDPNFSTIVDRAKKRYHPSARLSDICYSLRSKLQVVLANQDTYFLSCIQTQCLYRCIAKIIHLSLSKRPIIWNRGSTCLFI